MFRGGWPSQKAIFWSRWPPKVRPKAQIKLISKKCLEKTPIMATLGPQRATMDYPVAGKSPPVALILSTCDHFGAQGMKKC